MVQRIRFSYIRGEDLKFISHLDILRFLHRAFRRAGFPLAYRGKFNPQPRLDPGIPLPLGITSEGEYGEVHLHRGKPGITGEDFITQINSQLPAALKVTNAALISLEEDSLMEQINCSRYRVEWDESRTGQELWEVLEEGKNKILESEELVVERRGKKKKGKRQMRQVDVRPFVYTLEVSKVRPELFMLLQTGNRGGVSPVEVLQLMKDLTGRNDFLDHDGIHRMGLFRREGNLLETPYPFNQSFS